MKIHKEGYPTLRNLIIIYSILLLILLLNNFSLVYLTTIFLILFIICLNFFRIPNRSFEKKDGVIYSPCDGKVVVIEETNENEYYKDKRIQVSVFMSPLNVHNNLYPISGEVDYTKYHPGKYLVAWNPKSSIENERNSVVIKNKKISILCRQIAGALARRIVCYAKKGLTIKTSDEFGFIKFGSRVDVFLPIGTKVTVKLNDKVIGGKTKLAIY